jgi:acyl-homoserine lactone acylase PvdQ
MAPDGENFRAINAARLLSSQNNFTIQKMIATGYNRKLTAFEVLLPALIKAYEKSDTATINKYHNLAEPINVLKNWDYNMDENSVATLLAIEWAEKLPAGKGNIYISDTEKSQTDATKEFAIHASPEALLQPLLATIKDLKTRHGDWKIAWGSINRYQRSNSDLELSFNDDSSSLPIGFASPLWGALPAYASKYYYDSDKRYGISVNSFVCSVEFGKKINAYSLLAAGESSHPNSPHFNDQLEAYCKGKFKPVLFYKEDVLQQLERQYRPGE